MELSPGRYMCRKHGLDLTEKVKESLQSEVVVGYGFRAIRHRSSGRPFRVIVECPGTKGDSHSLAFEGKVVEQ
jgi:hypothetical protein